MNTQMLKAVVVSSLAASVLAFPAHPRELIRTFPHFSITTIKNGGFESGLSGWSVTAAFDGGVTTTEAYSGSYSLEMEAMDFVYQNLSFPKRVGTLTFAALADDPIRVGPAYVFVEYEDGSESEMLFGGAYLSSGDWTEFELLLDDTKRVTRVTFALGESYPIYIDDIALNP